MKRLSRKQKVSLVIAAVAFVWVTSCCCCITITTPASTSSTAASTELVPTSAPPSTPMPAPITTPAATATPASVVSTPTSMATPAPITTPTSMATSWACPSSLEGALYVASSSSNKFHRVGCHFIDKILAENRICFSSREAAAASGRQPCGACNP